MNDYEFLEEGLKHKRLVGGVPFHIFQERCPDVNQLYDDFLDGKLPPLLSMEFRTTFNLADVRARRMERILIRFEAAVERLCAAAMPAQ